MAFRADPGRPLRRRFQAELLTILRGARTDAIQQIREALKRRQIDVEEIARILQQLDERHLGTRAERVIETGVRTSYQQGVDHTLANLQIAPKPPGSTLQIAASFTLKDEAAIKNLVALDLSELKGITAETSRRIVRDLVEADKQGAGITRMTEIVYDDFNTIGMARAERIMRTSITQSYNDAAWSRVSQYAPYKEWIPTLSDGRTRESHRKMKGIIIPVDEPFVVPAFRPTPKAKTIPEAQMMFPGDTSLGAHFGQIGNCRCALAGRFLKK